MQLQPVQLPWPPQDNPRYIMIYLKTAAGQHRINTFQNDPKWNNHLEKFWWSYIHPSSMLFSKILQIWSLRELGWRALSGAGAAAASVVTWKGARAYPWVELTEAYKKHENTIKYQRLADQAGLMGMIEFDQARCQNGFKRHLTGKWQSSHISAHFWPIKSLYLT